MVHPYITSWRMNSKVRKNPFSFLFGAFTWMNIYLCTFLPSVLYQSYVNYHSFPKSYQSNFETILEPDLVMLLNARANYIPLHIWTAFKQDWQQFGSMCIECASNLHCCTPHYIIAQWISEEYMYTVLHVCCTWQWCDDRTRRAVTLFANYFGIIRALLCQALSLISL